MNNEWEHILSEFGEELLEEESSKKHTFTENYIRQKKILLSKIKKGQRFGGPLAKAAAVLLIFCCIVPVTVVATVYVRKYVMKHSEQGQYGHEYMLDKPDDSINREVKHVKIMTEFPTEYEESEYLKWETKDGKQLSMALLFVTAGGGNISLENILYTEDMDIDGNRGVYHEYQNVSFQENPFDKMAVIFYEELGYVLEVYGTENIGRAEFMDLMKQVYLTETTLEEADKPVMVVTPGENDVSGTELETEADIVKQDTVFSESFPTIGDGGMTGEEAAANICVRDMQTAVSVNELEGGSFDQRFLELAGVDEDGVVRYQAQVVKRGDGINSLDEVIGEKTIERQFLVVTMELENTTDKDVVYWLGGGQIQLKSLQKPEDTGISIRPMTGFLGFGYPVWSMGMQTRRFSMGENQAAFKDCVVLKSGEKKIIQVAFSVSGEELQEDLYVEIKGHLVKITGY